jgi:hypothetical protein
MVDPWEGCYVDRAVTFPKVIERLKNYLWDNGFCVNIAFVFGSDNAAFARAFVNSTGYLAVCVERPGNENVAIMNEKAVIASKHIYFVDGGMNISSTQVRKMSEKVEPKSLGKTYVIRDDSDFCVHKTVKKNVSVFKEKLEKKLAEILESDKNIFWVNALEQQKLSDGIPEPKLILDLWTRGENRLEITRLFSISDSQRDCIQLTNRVGFDSLDTQLMKLKKLSYTLIDDDICTGTTVSRIKESVPSIIIKDEVSLLELQNIHDVYDVMDLRDWILGSAQGGLTVKYPDGDIGRVPYISPFVNLYHRAKIPVEHHTNFSKFILDLNLELYSESKLLIGDMDPSFVQFAVKHFADRETQVYSFIKKLREFYI